MANQINIDIGAAANDGTGDPLRTAFNYVNLNFANVWATGLPNSNVQFDNNRVLTVNTNANLILAPNGTGTVQSNVSILPNIDRVHNLGSTGKKWNNIYANYLNIDQLEIGSDLTVGGNLTVQGNTIQIGNIVTDTKTIQLSNTAANTAAANGSGITVGANDNIATLLYNSSSNVWTTNIGISVVGNITAPYFIGNGSLLTGITSYSNANVAAYLPTYSGNISAAYINVANNVNVINDVVAKRGSFTGDPVTGDASMYVGSPSFTNLGTDVMAQFTGNVPAYAQINLQNYGNSNTASADYIITADNGNDTTHFLDLGLTGSNWDGTQPNSLGNRLGPNDGYLYVQDGDFVLGTSNGTIETWKFDQSGNLTVPGDILPVGNNTQSLGSVTNQWKDLWVSNNTIYINSVPIGITAGNVLTVNGQDVVTTNANGTVDLANLAVDNNNIFNTQGQGVIISNFNYVTDEAETAYVYIPAGNSPSELQVVQEQGDVRLTANTATWLFSSSGNLTLPQNGNINGADGWTARFQTLDEGEVRAGITLSPGYGLTRLESFDNQNSNGYSTSDWSTGEYIDNGGFGEIVFTDAPSIISFFSTIDTSRVFYQVNGGNLLPSAGWGSGGNNITFYTAIPPATSPETVTSFTIYYSNRSAIEMDYDEGEMNLIARDLDINITGDQSIDLVTRDIIRLQNTGNSSGVAVITDAGNAFHTWNFLPTGNLALPLGGVISEGPSPSYLGDAVTITPANGNDPNQQLKIYPTIAEGNHLHLTSGNLAVTDIFLGDDRQYIRTTTTEGMTIGTGGGEIFGGYTWSFDNGGALTFPDGANINSGAFNGTASATVALNAFSPSGDTVSIQAQGNTSSAVISIFSNAGPVTSNWTFTTAPLDPTESFLYIPNGGAISTPDATGGEGGKNIFIQAGASDPVTWNSNPGGEIIIKGGYGSFGDGGGGPGGDVNIEGGPSSDSHAGNVNINSGLNTWVFDYTGNLTLPSDSFSVNYANGTPVSLGGSYGNTDVATFLANYGSNTISTTGNITAGNLIGNISITGNVQGTSANVELVAGSYQWTFNNTGNLVLPGNTFAVNYANGTAVSLGGGSSYGNSDVVANLAALGSNPISSTANITTTANISGGNLITTGTFQSSSISSTGNITSGAGFHVILGNATSSLRQNSSNATVNLGGSITLTPDTGASALNGVTIGGNGYLLAPNGARVLTLGGNNALTVSGNLTLGGSIGSSRFTTLGETTTGANAIVAGQSPVILANSSATFSANVNNYTQITFQNRNTGADATADYILTADNGNDTTNYGDFGIINSGYDNSTPTNSLGNIVFAADTYVYAQGNISNTAQSGGNLVIGTTTAGKNVKIFAGGNTASALIANISNVGMSLPTTPAFRVYGNGVTSVSTTTNGTGVLNGNNWATDYNQGSYLNSTTGVFTAPIAGLYQVNLNARVANNSGSASQAIVYKNYGGANATQVMWETAANCTVNHFGVGTVSKLAVGDTLTLVVTVGQLTFDSNDSWSVAFLG